MVLEVVVEERVLDPDGPEPDFRVVEVTRVVGPPTLGGKRTD